MKQFESQVLKQWTALAVSLVVAISTFPRAANAAGEQPNPYPFAKSTYWAWQNRPDLPANLGAAKDWGKNASEQGFPTGRLPRIGDIAVYDPGVLGADMAFGHVAYVEQMLGDGTYMSSQMDETDCRTDSGTCGRVNRRAVAVIAGTLFIHPLKDTRTTWGFAAGSSEWTASGLGAGNLGGPGWFYPISGADPQLVSPELEIPLNGYNEVEVEMVTGMPVKDATVQIYFETSSERGFSEARSSSIAGQADGALHKYGLYFGKNVSWKGTLTRLRLDPAGGGSVGGVRIDRVRLVRSEPEDPGDYTTLNELMPARNNGGRSR